MSTEGSTEGVPARRRRAEVLRAEGIRPGPDDWNVPVPPPPVPAPAAPARYAPPPKGAFPDPEPRKKRRPGDRGA